jgi:hypothetical protein
MAGCHALEVGRIMDRKLVSFEQAEGRAPLPTQLALKKLSPQLRAQLFFVFDMHVLPRRGDHTVAEPWNAILKAEFVFHQNRFSSEYISLHFQQIRRIQTIIENGDYVEVFGFIEWILRFNYTPAAFRKHIADVLVNCHAAYRVVDGDTIAPITDPTEAAALEAALKSARAVGITGAYAHLRSSIEAATAGKYPDCVREAIHAVEAVAVQLAPGSTTLGPALVKLEKAGAIHEAMKKGFSALYGYASDEKGIRHSLLDQDAANVDEADALFMLGACASFVSYLIAKGRLAGLLTE